MQEIQGRLGCSFKVVRDEDRARAMWPSRARLEIYRGGVLADDTHLIFSDEAGQYLATRLDPRFIDEVGVAAIKEAVTDLQLPPRMTREDRILRALPRNLDTAVQFINVFTGSVAPEEDSMSQATFVHAAEGMRRYYAGFPAHVVLRLQNVRAPYGSGSFSTEGARQLLKSALEHGFVVADDDPRLYASISSLGLVESDVLIRPDRIAASRRSDVQRLLEFAFDYARPELPARFEACGERGSDTFHVHAYAYDLMPLVGERDAQSLGLDDTYCSQVDACAAIETSLQQGAILPADRDRLLGDLETIGLPESVDFAVTAANLLQQLLVGMEGVFIVR